MDHESAVGRNLTERYFLGELSAAEAAEFELHFFECAICAEQVRQASRLVANLKSVLKEAPTVGVIEVDPDSKLLTLTLAGPAVSGVTVAECEFRHDDLPTPIVVHAPLLDRSIQLAVPINLIPAGSCVLIVRDKESRVEIQRHRLIISH